MDDLNEVDMLEGAQHLRLEGSTLKGVLKTSEGGWHNSEINLDNYIGNANGENSAAEHPYPLPQKLTMEEKASSPGSAGASANRPRTSSSGGTGTSPSWWRR